MDRLPPSASAALICIYFYLQNAQTFTKTRKFFTNFYKMARKPEEILQQTCNNLATFAFGDVKSFFHVPNERKSKILQNKKGKSVPITGVKLKMAGVESGVSDFIFTIPLKFNNEEDFLQKLQVVSSSFKSKKSRCYVTDFEETVTPFYIHSIAVELKCGNNRLSENQLQFREDFTSEGNLHFTCYTAEDFAIICNFITNNAINKKHKRTVNIY